MKRNRIITFVINDLDFFISHRINLIDVCFKLNLKINIITPNLRKDYGPLKNVRLIRYYLNPRGKNVFLEFFSFLSLFFKLIFNKSDIYHFISLKPIIYGGIYLLLNKKKSIFSFSGLGFFKNINKKKFYSKILIKVIYLIFNSNFEKKMIFQNSRDLKIIKTLIKDKNDKDLFLINGSGVNLNYYFNIYKKKSKDDVTRFTFASRLLKEKGIEVFIKSIEHFLSNFKHKNKIEFIICGDFINDELIWKKENEFTNYIKNFDKAVKYFGKLNDLEDIFKKSSAIVLPTFYGEGIPKILCESLACGIPIITTNQRGCRELIDGNKNGLICKSKDHKDLAKQFNNFLNFNDKEINIMSKNCLDFANKHLSISEVSKSHEKIYKTILF